MDLLANVIAAWQKVPDKDRRLIEEDWMQKFDYKTVDRFSRIMDGKVTASIDEHDWLITTLAEYWSRRLEQAKIPILTEPE